MTKISRISAALFLYSCAAHSQTGPSSTHPLAAPTSSNPNLSVSPVKIAANDLVWDAVSQKIYLSIPSAAGLTGNAVQVLDPVTAALGANVFVGSEPNLLSISATGKYIYVGLNGASAMQRLTLPNLGPDIKIQFGGSFYGNYYPADVQASPVDDRTVAIVLNAPGVSPGEEGGVRIFDDATQRPNVLCGFIQAGCTGSGGELFDSLQWNATATTMYAINNEDTGFDFYTIPVTSAGFGKPVDYGGVAGGFTNSIHFDETFGYVYEDSGGIIDPNAGAVVGRFGISGLMVPDGVLGMAFFISTSTTGTSGTYTITAVDMERLTPIATAAISNVVGVPTHLIRWGTNGLAFTTGSSSGASSTASAVYVLSGSFIGPAPGVPPSIRTNGVVPVGSSSTVVEPGEWVSIYGSTLSRGTATWKGDFPTSLGGTTVLIDGNPAYLSYVSPGQVNVQVPDDTATGPVSVTVMTGNGSAISSVTLAEFGPSIPLLDTTHAAAIIVRTDGSGAYGGGTYDIVGPAGSSLGYPTVPAKAGDIVSLFALGLGPTSPVVHAGAAFAGAAPTTNTVFMTVGNVSVTPAFAGLSSAGLYQVNFTVPAGAGTGDKPVVLTVGGAQTPPGTMLTLK